jgi:thiamine-monophosphate kinase
MKTLRDIGELGVIERICNFLPGRQDVAVGAGDDCAVVNVGGSEDLVLTSDPVIEGVHFVADADPEDIGRKAMGRVLSDIASMGAEPRWTLIDVVAPGSTPVTVIDGIYKGMVSLASEFSVAVAGGDMAEGSSLEIHVFGVGAVPKGSSMLRSTAASGDILFVTGRLGGSSLGRHLQVEPRIREGLWLRGWASAMIDVSDGLASDLRHIVDMSGVGCRLDLEKIPVSEEAEKMPDDLSAAEHALYDGEDFELLFTLPADKRDLFLEEWGQEFGLPCTEIGVMTSEIGVIRCQLCGLETGVLEQRGYTHFLSL